MADRTSAEIFGTVFEFLSEEPTPANKKFARRLFDMAQNYDFNDYQMEADEALMALGLARRGVDPEYPEDGETIIYGPTKEKRR